MKLMKSLTSTLIATSLLGFSALTYAQEIVVQNLSKFDLSIFRSSQFPTVALRAGNTLAIDDSFLDQLCEGETEIANSTKDFYVPRVLVNMINQYDNPFLEERCRFFYLNDVAKKLPNEPTPKEPEAPVPELYYNHDECCPLL